MECVYVDDEPTVRTVIPSTIETSPLATFKPMQLHHNEVFRPIIKEPQPVHREKSFTIRKPIPKLDVPLEKITFACFTDYLQYKKLYGS